MIFQHQTLAGLPRGKNSGTQNRGLFRPHSLSGRFGEDTNPMPLSVFETWIAQSVVWSLYCLRCGRKGINQILALVRHRNVIFYISHLKTDTRHIYYKHHFTSTTPFRHFSAPKRQSSGSRAHAFEWRDQQNESPDIKFCKSNKTCICDVK
jgi:hypothetical protein